MAVPYTFKMAKSCIFKALCLAFLFPAAAQACMLKDAVFVPDAKDYRVATNHYLYAITVAPDARHFTLNILDPETQVPVTLLRMAYDMSATPEAALSLTPDMRMDVSFFDGNFLTLHPKRATDEAPRTLILRDGYMHFLTLPKDGASLDISYLTPQKVRPGAAVNGRLELVPDTWSLGKCAGG